MKNRLKLLAAMIGIACFLFCDATRSQTSCKEGNDIFSLIGMRADTGYVTDNFTVLHDPGDILPVERINRQCGTVVEYRKTGDKKNIITKVTLYGPNLGPTILRSLELKGYAETLPANIKWESTEKEIKKLLKSDKNFDEGKSNNLYISAQYTPTGNGYSKSIFIMFYCSGDKLKKVEMRASSF